jgi:hypothetical protein
VRIPSTILAAALALSAAVAVPPTAAQAETVTPSAVGHFYPVSPARILDTRNGNGAPKAPIGPGGVLHLQVAGRGGVPATDVSAVVFNVTVVSPTAGGYLTVYPGDVSRPTASSLNFPKGWTGSNSVTVGLGTNGQVDIFNSAGYTQVVVDVTGYFAATEALVGTNGVGGGYFPFDQPFRAADTRTDGDGPVASKDALPVLLDFNDPNDPVDYNAHVRALAVNITVVNPPTGGYVTGFDGGPQLPPTSTVNFSANTITPNFAVIPTRMCDWDPSCADYPMIAVYNGSSAALNVIVDVFGFFDDGAGVFGSGLRFHPIKPTRIVDSRIGLGTPGALGPASTRTMAPGAVAGLNTVALAMNVTAVSPTSGTYFTVWPSIAGLPRPTVSNLNPAKGQVVPNAVWTTIGDQNKFNVYNNAGTVNIVIDVNGTYEMDAPALDAASAFGAQSEPRAITPSSVTPLAPRPAN